MTRTELHFHLLPEVDDGPVDLDDAVALARLAVADGTSLVTVTPHVRDLIAHGILGELPARVREVQAALDAPASARGAHGCRARARRRRAAFDARMLDAIAQGPPDARWVLIEAPLFGGDADGSWPRRPGSARRVRDADRPSRAVRALMERPDAIAAERRGRRAAAGQRVFAIGAPRRGERARGLALLRAGQADVIASDAHRAPGRRGWGRARGARRARDPRRRGLRARRPARVARARARRAAAVRAA